MTTPLASAAARVDEFTRTDDYKYRLPRLWVGGSGDRVLGAEVSVFLESALELMVENRRDLAKPEPEPVPEPVFVPVTERRTVFKLWLPGRSKADPFRIAQLERELGLAPQPAPQQKSRWVRPVSEMSLWTAMHEVRRRAGYDAWSVAAEVLSTVVRSQSETGEGYYDAWTQRPGRSFAEVQALISLGVEFARTYGPQLGGA